MPLKFTRLNQAKILLRDIVLFLIIAVFSSLVWSCKNIDPCQQKEILRKTSLDKLVDYVVIEKDCGATTSVSDLVYIVPVGKSVEEFSPVFRADHTEGLEVRWIAPKQMTIAYKKARIFSYTNFWHSRHVNNFNYEVFIQEFQK